MLSSEELMEKSAFELRQMALKLGIKKPYIYRKKELIPLIINELYILENS